jgi:rsbT co-antagonist protein RsbR
MLWHNLRLRTRILLGYSLMFALIAALALFLTLRTDALNTQIRQLNAEVSAEAATGAQLASQVAATQQAIDRYLQQPQPSNLQTATESLQGLEGAVASAQTVLVSLPQRQRLEDLRTQLAQYQQSLQSLNTLIETQDAIRADLNQYLFGGMISLNDAITQYLTNDHPDPLTLAAFVRAQRSQQLSIFWSSRLVTEQSESLGKDALDELTQVDFNLRLRSDLLDRATASAVERVRENAQFSATTISQYMANLRQIRQQRHSLLTEQGGKLKAQADAIAEAALAELTVATTDLERQSRQTQQLTAVALVLTMLIAAAFGGLLPRSMSRPLNDLVTATRRLNQGDYAAVVATRDRSEIGQLAAAFNQMTAALRQQRAEVLHQQATLAERNQELEQTLCELQAATAARETLAATVRTLSVPVVPILERVVMIPLVGEIDAERAAMLLDRLLDTIVAQGAAIAILDVTGVPMVDVSLVGWLIRASVAARLLGAQCILVGISPEVAQALVASGADLADLTTRSDLRSAVEQAIRATGFSDVGNPPLKGEGLSLVLRSKTYPRP